MIQMVLGAAFSAVPLILLIPPVRMLSVFVVKFEDLFQDFASHTFIFCARLRFASSVLRRSSFRNQPFRR